METSNKIQKHQYCLDYFFNEHNEKLIKNFKDARDLLNEHRSNLPLKKNK